MKRSNKKVCPECGATLVRFKNVNAYSCLYDDTFIVDGQCSSGAVFEDARKKGRKGKYSTEERLEKNRLYLKAWRQKRKEALT
jgi:hypothetical protein